MQFPLYMQHHQFELISGVYLVYMHLQCISGVYAASSCQHSSGQHSSGQHVIIILEVQQPKSLSRSTIFGWAFRWEILHSLEWSYSHDFKPIYLHYLYLFRGKTIGKSGCSSRCICSSTLTLFLKPIYHFIGVEQFTCFWVEQFTRLCIVWSGAIHMILKPIYLHYLYLFRGKTIGKSGCSSRCICSIISCCSASSV